MNTIKIALGWLLQIIEALWVAVSNVSGIVVNTAGALANQIRRYIRIMVIIIAVEIISLIVGFIFNFKPLILFSGVTAGLLLLLCWKISEVAIRIIASFGSKLPLIKSAVAPITEELKKLLLPLITFSLFIAFIAAVITIKGPAQMTWTDLMAWTALIIPTVIFTIYIDSKKKIAGWAMIGCVYYLFFVNFFAPIQAQGIISWVERKTIGQSIDLMDQSKNYEMVVLKKDAPLYELNWWDKFKKTGAIKDEVVAKVVDRKNDPISKEPMYGVILPTAKDIYVGNETVYVPARMATTMQINKGEHQPQEKIVTFRPNEPTNSGLIAQIGDTVEYKNPTATFKVPGKEQFHSISTTTQHKATGVGSIVIYGHEKEGYVQIKVIPKIT
ncbi:MAG: hypothetical protein WC422_04960 [Candidatus Paceibacterota bacterium]|jgi:hypothetical protein